MRSIHFLLMLEAYRLLKATLVFIFGSTKVKPVPVLDQSLYNKPRNVSVIVPTINPDESFPEAFTTWYRNAPREIVTVTTDVYLDKIRGLVTGALQATTHNVGTSVDVCSIPRPSKRKQMAYGITRAVGEIIVLCDDDAFWPTTELLPNLLTCFKKAEIGGVGTLQFARLPRDRAATVWETMAAQRLRQRNLNIMRSNSLDGSVTCLSGRTAAYRALILKNKSFLQSFTNDLWRGKYRLDSGDDTFITRWLYSQGWGVQIQTSPMANIDTIVLNSADFLKQQLRWARNSRRSFIRCLFGIPKIYRRYPYLFLIMTEETLQPMIVACAIFLWLRVFREEQMDTSLLLIFVNEMRRIVKAGTSRLNHEEPFSLRDLMTALLYGITRTPLNVYAYATLDEVCWGSRDQRAFEEGTKID